MTTQAQHRSQRARKFTHCQRCGKPKTTPTTRQKDVPKAAYECDPYCSRACCENDHLDTRAGHPGSDSHIANALRETQTKEPNDA